MQGDDGSSDDQKRSRALELQGGRQQRNYAGQHNSQKWNQVEESADNSQSEGPFHAQGQQDSYYDRGHDRADDQVAPRKTSHHACDASNELRNIRDRGESSAEPLVNVILAGEHEEHQEWDHARDYNRPAH